MAQERVFIRVEVYGGVASVTQCPARGVEIAIVDHDNRSTYRVIDGQAHPAEGYKKHPRPSR